MSAGKKAPKPQLTRKQIAEIEKNAISAISDVPTPPPPTPIDDFGNEVQNALRDILDDASTLMSTIDFYRGWLDKYGGLASIDTKDDGTRRNNVAAFDQLPKRAAERGRALAARVRR